MIDKEKKLEQTSQSVISKMYEHLRAVFNRYFKQFPQYEELLSIINDENNTCPNGKPSEEYQKLLNDLEKFCANNPIDIEAIAKEDDLSADKLEVLKGAKDFLDKQNDLMRSYRDSSDKDEWADQMLDSEEKRKAYNTIVEESMIKAFEDFERIKK